ncbi:hypothetical protein BpHYR1_014796 [Brachionus plicatilis]|uniref:Uncharacterized protein n=1 Tax=Brachionus plicatilis TaxID=10195 RepID=A0A3M7ST18_BRAPC|nr:hypothetical protein BpHYR1_014796 [Brachionus plicatilis]
MVPIDANPTVIDLVDVMSDDHRSLLNKINFFISKITDLTRGFNGKSPPKLLDLNPIEVIWNEMKEFVRKRNIQNDEEAVKCQAYINHLKKNKVIKIVIKKWKLVKLLAIETLKFFLSENLPKFTKIQPFFGQISLNFFSLSNKSATRIFIQFAFKIHRLIISKFDTWCRGMIEFKREFFPIHVISKCIVGFSC